MLADLDALIKKAESGQGVAEGDRPGMKDGRPYSDPLRRHPGNDSYMTPEYLIQKYQDELKKIAAGPYKRTKDVAMYKARIAKLQRQQGVAEGEGNQEIGQQMADDGITYSSEKENEIINLMAQYMQKAGMSSKQIRYLLSYDEDYVSDQLSFLPRQGLSEVTGDTQFDAMMQRVAKKPTQAQRNAERIRQKKEREAETRAHFANGGGFGPSPADKLSIRKQGVAEGVAETLPIDDAVKVLRQYGADNFKTTSNELHFYKQGRPFSVDLVMNPDATRSVTLSSLNSATRGLKGQGVAEGQEESCPHCGGAMFSEMIMNEKKDACYYKVKSRYKVWPSAYASGALVKCRKSGADSWGDGGKKNESSILEGIEQVDENLNKWFKEKWVRFGPDGKIRGDCARGDDSEGKPKCLPQSKAQNLGKEGRASAASRKRREDPNPERSGKAINVNTKKK
jgi:hypothetical protein